ncbi:MAG: DoxX family protein [Rhodobacteraceae bacterium]|nr:DoxX family protein [Paracoccaceae bacterium]
MESAYVVWAVRIALAGFFGFHAVLKLSGYSGDVQLFEQIGYGQWFRYVTGLVEAAAAILMLLPGFTALGGLLILGTMSGAILTKITVLERGFALELVIALVAAWLVWRFRDQILALLP